MSKKIFMVLLAFWFIGSFAYAQDDEKEWKKKKKDMDPMTFKDKMLRLNELENENKELEGEVSRLKDDLQKALSDNAKLEDELKEAKANTSGVPSEVSMASSKGDNGIVFKVQIGAFRNKDLTKYFDNNPNFSGDVDADGQKKYTLGYFTDYWEANTFKKYLREMGVSDAWIVSYKDGRRVPIKDVLEGVYN